MNAFYDALANGLENGRSAVLCTVLESHGSVPRGAGACMALFEDGSKFGSVGGGAVELFSEKEAEATFLSCKSHCVRYVLSADEMAGIGMICGGRVLVSFEYLQGENADCTRRIRRMAELCGESKDAWCAVLVRGDELVNSAPVAADADAKFADDLTLALLPGRDRLPAMDVGLCVQGKDEDSDTLLYIYRISRSGRTYIFGAGHVARELCALLAHVGFAVTVLDERAELLTKENFPNAESLRHIDFGAEDWCESIGSSDYAVVMTAGHASDYTLLCSLLKRHPVYIGCIGSKNKAASICRRLIENGFSKAEAESVHSPVGLAIKAQTPAEIAVSIAAEMIYARAEAGG